ncbi:MAG TPA: amidohydrolase [Pseudolabrys sp.]|nr:amidohydrolase [Pseudolabrys sp.]
MRHVSGLLPIIVKGCLTVAVGLTLLSSPGQAQDAADILLTNGKIVTVDDRFSIVQALAIRGSRIEAVGTTADIERLKGPQTKVIDLAGRTVIPGLIDNHAHWIRAAEHDEVRFDGVTSRARALKLIADRVGRTPPGEWIAVLGGWSEEQFLDSQQPFTRAELDATAPKNPVAVQSVYNHTVLNTAALKAAGVDAATPDPKGGEIEHDAKGEPTGLFTGGGAVGFVAAKIPLKDFDTWLAQTRALVAMLNSLGVTAWMDAGGRGISEKHYEPFRALAEKGELNIRAFYTVIRMPATPAQLDAAIADVKQLVPFQGNDYFGNIGYGEVAYGPLYTQLLRPGTAPRAEDLAQFKRLIVALAERGLYFNSHVEMEPVIDAMLDVYEEVNKAHPIKGLRWSFAHLDQVTEAELARMKELGMMAQLHSRPLIQGALMHKVHGDRAWDMPPFRRVQDSGIHWGLGSDATAVTPSNPFYTLSFAVTGEMIGGRKVNRQSISREEALIAHTRNNAAFLFQENNIGSLAPGKYADLLILDRDYLTVPVSEIKEIKPVLTMVGGKVVYEAKKQ